MYIDSSYVITKKTKLHYTFKYKDSNSMKKRLTLLLVIINTSSLFSQIIPIHCDSLVSQNQILNLSPFQDTVSFSIDNIALSASQPGLTNYISTSVVLDNDLVIDSVGHTKTSSGLTTYLYQSQDYVLDIHYSTSIIPNNYSVDGAFEVFVSGLNSSTCRVPFTMHFNTVAPVKEIGVEHNDIKIYPNPSSNSITINSDFKIDEIQILNTSGISLLKSKDKVIDINALPSGVYFLKILYNDENKLLTIRKVIKN